MVGINRVDVLNYILKELGYIGKSPIEKVYAKYSNMSKKDYNKLVYRIFKEYNRYFKPAIQDKVIVNVENGVYKAIYTYYEEGIKDEISLVLN